MVTFEETLALRAPRGSEKIQTEPSSMLRELDSIRVSKKEERSNKHMRAATPTEAKHARSATPAETSRARAATFAKKPPRRPNSSAEQHRPSSNLRHSRPNSSAATYWPSHTTRISTTDRSSARSTPSGTLQSASDASAFTEISEGASEIKSDETSAVSEEKTNVLRLTEQAVKRWTLKEKVARVPESTMRYAIPDKVNLDLVEEHADDPCARNLKNARDSLHSRKINMESSLRCSAFVMEDSEVEIHRTQLSVYDAAKELADANISLSAVKDLLDRFQDPSGTRFTHEYLVTQHLYGTMSDYIRDLWVTTSCLSKDLDIDALEQLDESTKARFNNIAQKTGDENVLAAWLKHVLSKLNSLQWESIKGDFQKWMKNAQEQDAILRDALEYIGDHMDVVLNLLTISRYAIEEALGTHLFVAATELTKYYGGMTKWTQKPDPADPENKLENTYRSPRGYLAPSPLQASKGSPLGGFKRASSVNQDDLRLQYLLSLAQDEKERCRRNLEMNRGLRDKMLEARGERRGSLETKLESDLKTVKTQPVSQTKTIIINAPGSAAKPVQEVKKQTPKPNMKLNAPMSHLIDMIARCIDQCRTALDDIHKCARERDKHKHKVRLYYEQRHKEARLGVLRAHRSSLLEEVLMDSPRSRGSTIAMFDACFSVGRGSIDSSLFDLSPRVGVPEKYLVDRRDIMDDSTLLNVYEEVHKRTEADRQWLERRKQLLFDQLNTVSVSVSLAGIWGGSQTVHQASHFSDQAVPLSSSLRRMLEASKTGQEGRESPLSRSSSFCRSRLGSESPSRPPSRPQSASHRAHSRSASHQPHSRSASRAGAGGSDASDDGQASLVSLLSFPRPNLALKSVTDLNPADYLAGAFEVSLDAFDPEASIEQVLDICVEMEAKVWQGSAEIKKLSELNRKLVAEVARRFGDDAWLYDDEVSYVWFKKNPRDFMMKHIMRGATNVANKGLLLLGRDGETHVKEFLKELRMISRARAQEHEECERCANAYLEFDHAAWHFRVNSPFDALLEKYAPIWKGLTERVGLANELDITLKSCGFDVPLMGDIDKDSNCSENSGGSHRSPHSQGGFDAKSMEDVVYDYRQLQAKMLTTQTDRRVKKVLLNKMEEETEYLLKTIREFEEVNRRTQEIRSCREELIQMREEKKALNLELQAMSREFARLSRVSPTAERRYLELEELRAKLHARGSAESGDWRLQNLAPFRQHERVDLRQMCTELLNPLARRRQTPAFTDADLQSSRLSDILDESLYIVEGHENSPLRKRGKKLTKGTQPESHSWKSMFESDSDGLHARSRHSIAKMSKEEKEREKWEKKQLKKEEKLRNLNYDKIRLKIESAEKREKALSRRREKKRQEYEKLMERLKKMTGYSGPDGLPSNQEEIEQKLNTEMQNLQSQITQVGRMHKFWRQRFDQWHEEVRTAYGEDVVHFLSDAKRHDNKDKDVGKQRLNAIIRIKIEEAKAAKDENMNQRDDKLVRQSTIESKIEIKVEGPAELSVEGKADNKFENRVSFATKKRMTAQELLHEIDSERIVKEARGHKQTMLQDIEQAIKTMDEMVSEIVQERENRPYLQRLSQEKSNLMMLRSLFKGENPDTLAVRSQVRMLGGGLMSSWRKRGHLYRSSLARHRGSNRAHAMIDLCEEAPPDTPKRDGILLNQQFLGKAIQGRASRLHSPRGRLRFKKVPKGGIDLSLGFHHGKQGTIGDLSNLSDDESDEESDDDDNPLLQKMRRSSNERVSVHQPDKGNFAPGWSAKLNATTKESWADHLEALGARKKQLATRATLDRDGEDSNARLNMLRLFIDDAEDLGDTQSKRKRTRFRATAEVMRYVTKWAQRAQDKLKKKKEMKKMKKKDSKSRHGQFDLKARRLQARRPGLTSLFGKAASKGHGNDGLEVHGERSSSILGQTREAVLNRLLLNHHDLASERASIISSLSSRSSSKLSSFGSSDEQLNPWQEAASEQQGLQLLRVCRERLLQEFGSFDKAFDHAIPSACDDKLLYMHYDAFEWLTGTVGFDQVESRLMFEHVARASGHGDLRRARGQTLHRRGTWNEEEMKQSNLEKIEKAHFAETLRSAVPLSNLTHLRIRLQKRYGRTDVAFDASSGGETFMEPSTFCSMLELVNGDASEARHLFAQIEKHLESKPAKDEPRQVSRRAVLKCLRYAEHLAAARKLCHHIHTVHDWQHNDTPDTASKDALHLVGGGHAHSVVVPDCPEHGNVEQLASAYNTLMQLIDIRYINRRLDLQELQTAVKTMSLSREDVHWLFRLTSRDSSDGMVSIQEVAIGALGGLGYRRQLLALRVGQAALVSRNPLASPRNGPQRCKTSAREKTLKAGLPFSQRRMSSQSSVLELEPSAIVRSKVGVGDIASGAEAEPEENGSAAEDMQSSSEEEQGSQARSGCQARSRSRSPPSFPRTRRDRPGAEMEPLGAAKRHWSWWLEDGMHGRAIVKKTRPREMVRKAFKSNWTRKGVLSHGFRPRPIDTEFAITNTVGTIKEGNDDEDRESFAESSSNSLPEEATADEDSSSTSSDKEAAMQIDAVQGVSVKEASTQGEVQQNDAGKRASAFRSNPRLTLKVPGQPSQERRPSQQPRGSFVRSATRGSALLSRGSAMLSPEDLEGVAAGVSTVELGTDLLDADSDQSPTRRPSLRPKQRKATNKELDKYRKPRVSIFEDGGLAVESKEAQKDQDDTTKWRFKHSPRRGAFLQTDTGSLRLAVPPDQSLRLHDTDEDTVKEDPRSRTESSNSDPKETRSPSPSDPLDDVAQGAHEELEGGRLQLRLDRFEGDSTELQMAMQKMQDFRVRLLTRFRTLGKAFEVLAGGSRLGKLELDTLQSKIEKLLSFNPLDARRVMGVLSIVQEEPELSYTIFLRVMRFAVPVQSVLEFRTRLVQMFRRVDSAFREIGLVGNEFDIGSIDRPMLGAGIVSCDARRIFRVVDAVRPGGPCGCLCVEDFEHALDNAHIVAWLEAFHVRVAANFKGRSVSDVIAGMTSSPEDALTDAAAFEQALAPMGFPAEFVPATFTFLEKSCYPYDVTLAALASIIHNAFKSDSLQGRKRSQAQRTDTKDLLKSSGVSNPHLRRETVAVRRETVAQTRKQFFRMKTTVDKVVFPNGGVSGSTEEAAELSLSSASPRLSSAGGVATVTEEVREAALVKTRDLRRQVMFSFANYQEAYDIILKRRPNHGIALDEWMEAMPCFGFSDTSGWELIFGHMVDWQHMRWDPRFRGTEGRVTIAILANSLDQAAPCQTPLAFRALVQEKFGTLQKAWAQLSGKEGIEEIGLLPWKHALQKLGVTGDDAGFIHTLLRAAPISERNADAHSQQLSRVAFMATMRGAEPVTRLFELLDRLRKEHGVVSRAFEANPYPQQPLPPTMLEEQLAALLQVAVPDVRMIISYLDFHQDNLVAVDDLLDGLTAMQAAFLPNFREAERQPIDLTKRYLAEDEGSGDDLLPKLRSRSACGTQSSASSRPRSSMIGQSSPMSWATISPTDIKANRRPGSCSAASDRNSIHNISTALPDSDSDHSDGPERGTTRPRPWTSMEVSQDGSKRLSASGKPPLGRQDQYVNPSFGNFTAPAAKFLPHLDLASSKRGSEGTNDALRYGRSESMDIEDRRRSLEAPDRRRSLEAPMLSTLSQRSQRRLSELSCGSGQMTEPVTYRRQSAGAHQPELPLLNEALSVQPMEPVPKRRAQTLWRKGLTKASAKSSM